MGGKICILTTVHANNDNRVYYKEVCSARKDFDVVYIAPELENRKEGNYETIGVKTAHSPLQRLQNVFRAFWYVKNTHCDICHFQDPELVVTGLLLKMFTKIKVIYDVHEDYPDQILTKYYLKNWIRKPLYKLMVRFEKMADKHFDGIVVADNYVVKHFSNPNTVIAFNYPDTATIDRALNGVERKQKDFDLIYPGSMNKHMIEIIVKAAALIKKQGCEIKVLLISPFKMAGGIDWVKEQIKEAGLSEESFTLMKRIPPDQVPKYIVRSKVGVIPLPDTKKMRQNIPTKLFEYMYCGIPVVASNLPPTAQFFKGAPFGFLADPNDAGEFATYIKQLLDSTTLREEYGTNGHTQVANGYNWKTEYSKICNLYCKLLNK